MLTRLWGLFDKKKKPAFVHLEVVIPNVLGLAFLADKTMAVFNLGSMSVVEGATTELDCMGQSPMVRWRKHETTFKFNETFFILVGVGDRILSFSLKMKYN